MIPAQAHQATTVLGTVSALELGHVQPHEHLVLDLSSILEGHPVEQLAALVGVAPAGFGRLRKEIEAPLELRNRYWVQRHYLNRTNLRLEPEAIEPELRQFVAAGGRTIVDCTTEGMGRDADALVRLSESTGAHIIMGAGYYVRDYHPPYLDELSTEQIADRVVADATIGVGASQARAGIIGEIGLSWPVHPVEERVLRAAVIAAQRTGLALQIHPGRDPRAPIQAVEAVERWGADPARVIVSHVDRTLASSDEMVQLAKTGCFLEFDMFGQETSFYPLSLGDLPNDAVRVAHIVDLLSRGHERILISEDVCQKVHLQAFGGWGLSHLLLSVLPLLRKKGLTNDEILLITRWNPAAVLTGSRPADLQRAFKGGEGKHEAGPRQGT